MSERPTPLDFLQAIYLNEGLPLNQRMRAAIEAAPYMHAKKGSDRSPIVIGFDFASLLEKAVARSGEVVNGKVLQIEGQVSGQDEVKVSNRNRIRGREGPR